MPTARNARGVDLLIYSQEASTKKTIQVKTLSSRNPVPLGSNLETLFSDFVVICRKVLSDRPESFVLLPSEIKQRAHRLEKLGKVSFWLETRDYEVEDYREAWHRIGTGL